MTKKIKPYSTARIKAKKILTNISYNSVTVEDLFDRNLFDVYRLTTKNINPFSFERNIFDMRDREMIQMFWEECNFIYLNGKNVIHLHVAEIVWKYIEEDEANIDKMKRKLLENQKIFQFVFSTVYPEVYTFVEKRVIELNFI